MTRATAIAGLMTLCLLVGFLVAIEAHQVDPPPKWLNARTLAIGRVAPIEQEQQECVFPVGTGAAVLLHPKGEHCQIMRELIGRTGRLVFIPD